MLTERQIRNDMQKELAKGVELGRVAMLKNVLDSAGPDVAVPAIKNYMDSIKWKAQAYETSTKANGNGTKS
jgi:hypothetical protein